MTWFLHLSFCSFCPSFRRLPSPSPHPLLFLIQFFVLFPYVHHPPRWQEWWSFHLARVGDPRTAARFPGRVVPRTEQSELKWLPCQDRLVGLVVKASASRAGDPEFKSRLRRDFSGVESYQWLKNWHSSGYPARRPALWGQHWDCLSRCQYTVTGWDGKLDLQLLSQCGNFYLSVVVRTIVWADPSLRYTHMLLGRKATNQQTTNGFFCIPRYLGFTI